jgi:hypothetical protein
MYGGVPLVGFESAYKNKLEKMICKGDPLSTLVKMGGRSALGVVHITRFIARSGGALQPGTVCCVCCWHYRAR